MFRNEQVVIHVIRPGRGRAVVAEVLAEHRPQVRVSDLFGAQRGHARRLAGLPGAPGAGPASPSRRVDAVFAPRLKALLLRAVVLARRRHALRASTRLEYRRRLERELDRVLALQPGHRHGRRLRRRYLAVRDSLFTFLEHPDAPPDNNGSERDLRPMVVCRKSPAGSARPGGGNWRGRVGLGAARRGSRLPRHPSVLSGRTVLAPG